MIKSFNFYIITMIMALSLNAVVKITGAGATFPAILYSQWAYDYSVDTKKRVNYQSVGSSSGVKQITSEIVDFGATDVALDKSELDENQLIQFPAIIGSIEVVVNINGIKDFELKLDNDTLSSIFLGEINKWNNPKIVALNKNLKLPDATINVIYRSDGSGTTHNFTDYLSIISDKWKKEVGSGKSVKWKVGLSGKGNEGVSNLVKVTTNSISYIEKGYKILTKLSGVTLYSKSGNWVTSDKKYVENAIKNGDWNIKNGYKTSLIYTKGDSYPIVSASYILLKKGNVKNSSILDFFEYAFSPKGDASAITLHYTPLNKDLQNKIIKNMREAIK